MDKHYKMANGLNYAFYIGVGAGAFVWLYDIIWVAAKGGKNRQEQKAYKRSHLSFYHQPEFGVTGLTYSLNF
jgi:hypothetical protein